MRPSRAAITPRSIDAEAGQIPPNGGEPGIVPDAIEALGHAHFPQRRKLDGGSICLYI